MNNRQCNKRSRLTVSRSLAMVFIFNSLLLCFSQATRGAVTPSCGSSPFPGLHQTTYNTSGYTSSPANAAAFQALISTYATTALEFGSGVVVNVNGSGNIYGSDDNYLNIMTGYIYIDTLGSYQFAVDGDDAIEVLINGTAISGYYGLHGTANTPTNPGSVTLDVGFHEISYHHHERTGADIYRLYWQRPGDTGFSITPPSVLFNCEEGLTLIPSTTVNCGSPTTGLFLSTYDKTGYGHPNNASDYQSLVDTYATSGNLFGDGTVANINGSGNPYGSNSNYLSIFVGYINIPVQGVYTYGIDGDDAIELLINGTVISGWYGGHGSSGSASFPVSLYMEAGVHTLEFRHEEVGGGDNYYLYWQEPSETSMTIMPGSAFSFCPVVPFLNVSKAANDSTANPGDNITYTITINNTGSGAGTNVVLTDTLSPFTALNINAYGASTPFSCTVGCPSSGLNLGSPLYSNDNGSTFSYTPSSGGGGAPANHDGNITHWRLPMSGSFNELTGSFTIEYRAVIE